VSTLTPVREAHCAVQLDPRIEGQVEILGALGILIMSSDISPDDDPLRHEDYAAYYAARATSFRSRPKLPRDTSTFYDELY
jgi:hypothetical protein